MYLWIWVLAVVSAVVLYLRATYTKLSKRGIKHFPVVPFLGNMGRVLTRQDHFADDMTRTYNAFPGERFVGRYEFHVPVIVLRDLELIKQVTIKDFEHFLDHRLFINEDTDPLFGRNLFALKGEDWKDMRGTLSPAFTSSKIRVMVPFMVEVGDQMIKALKEKIQASKDGFIDIDVKDLTTRYTNDVVASCAFGLKVNSHKDETNEFYMKGKEAATFKFKQLLVFFGFTTFPKIMNALKFSLFSEESRNFFRYLVKSTMQDREERNIIRPDMIHLLMEAKKGNLAHNEKHVADTDAGFATVEESSLGRKQINRVWTDDDLVAQAILFFIAGFESIASVMSFLLHELALNPEVQEKLLEEINKTEEKTGGKLNYSVIQEMKYMDMVVSEVLRKWPPGVAADRLCTKDYNLGKPNDKAEEDYIIRKGEGLLIPVWAFHRSPEFFPDPERFDPERFSDENKHNIKPMTYMPFGLGPRNCIGSRFALCEVKAMAYQLVKNMELSAAAKTQIPAQLANDTFNLRIKGGHWLRFRTRSASAPVLHERQRATEHLPPTLANLRARTFSVIY